ncbi:uncharacterized 2Fe-2S/4Fe-4S cluster protein (DUF4445 family) [Halanaerobium saccharolyticum]|uniref:Uncharacterized 2Fe-2S/4Fe-4S cluster protein (DUF4445 family) n=1 Tax=Halanaerobium saccharolyticum TaxID=43595 RepID=A0A4R6LU84_9FIRM|nr:ASKHA domain-containing protein [Halanaerobium saccharolyticum]TDO90118.1 uncharacterized 2Fe-2S/4Fe-4S cluster protein (DUF4445 family) [Halanaerobium saccharolyticum]
MLDVTFKNNDLTVEVEAGTKLAECIRKAGLSIETPCNGMGKCGKCQVKVIGEVSNPSFEEEKFIIGKEGVRLACLARATGPVEIELLASQNKLQSIDKQYFIDTEVNSEVKKVSLPIIDQDSGRPYLEELNYQLASIELYTKLGKLERDKISDLTGILYNDEIIDLNQGDILGLALDIGTTGLTVYLVDLETGVILNKISDLNPQTEFGGDVLSRISYCINQETGAADLKDMTLTKINQIIDELVTDEYNKDNIYRLIVAGNTTMLHLFLGVNPASIARSPYRPIFLEKLDFKAKELGIKINKNAEVSLLPSVSGYVGADIIAGVVATEFDSRKTPTIFIDIGTNGEIVVISDDKMAATSTAAGPALEGMNIACGCRAEVGAIEAFSIDDNFNISYKTIANKKAKGICGSGLIDITANLVNRKIILKNGRFNKNLNKKLKARLRDKKFYITEDIYISQKDIRQIQLAKGAIATGVKMLLEEIGISIVNVKEVIIAGSFGYHINPESIKEVGFIPEGFSGEITFVGNSSAQGARQALVNTNVLDKMVELRKKIMVLELSRKEDFQDYFIKELNF